MTGPNSVVACWTGAFLVCLAVHGAPAAGQAEPTVARLRSSLYQDDDATTISTSVVAVHAGLAEVIRLDAHYLVDAISSASIDVVSAATGRWEELRHEAEAGASYSDGTLTAGASYIYSTENDWSSHTVGLGVSRDFLGHDLTIGLGGSYVANNVERKNDENFREKLDVASGDLQVAIVGSPVDLISLNYSLSYANGYQASPYRFPRFQTEAIANQLFYVDGERHPDKRLRQAFTVRYNRHLFTDTAMRLHSRVYRDDWGIVSLTGGGEYVVGWGGLETSLFVRGYAQRHAKFYQDIYRAPQRYMTADRELSTFHDVFVGTNLAYTWNEVGPFEALRVDGRLSGFAFYFVEFSRLPERYGFTADLALEATF